MIKKTSSDIATQVPFLWTYCSAREDKAYNRYKEFKSFIGCQKKKYIW